MSKIKIKATAPLCASCGKPRKGHKMRHVFRAPKGQVIAIKSRKTKTNGWMPDRVVVLLEGDPKADLLMTCGWSITDTKTWDVERLERQLFRLERDWREDVGTGWKLEIV